MKNRLVALLLAAGLVLFPVACAGRADEPGGEPVGSVSPTESETPDDEETPEDEGETEDGDSGSDSDGGGGY